MARKHAPRIPTRAERDAAGRALRERVSRASHAGWKIAKRDPVALLEKTNRGRVTELVPIRYGRMLHDPFTFLRGAASVMAHDLCKTPASGLQAQLCGDCHLLNFGLFGTPERHLVFDVNDFDETLPGPLEWDLKRLAASLVVAARHNGVTDARARDLVMACSASYRVHMSESAGMAPMDVWYARLDWEAMIAEVHDAKTRKFAQQIAAQARKRIVEHLFPKIAKEARGHHRFIDQPPCVFHASRGNAADRVRDAFAKYRLTLPDDRRTLLDHYRFEDYAFKVVGIGSVGTHCFMVLMVSADGNPLILQFKEAGRSVLEEYAPRSAYENQGERVVMGQRLMQSSSDVFLGWARSARGRDFYVRQLRDMKMTIPVEHFGAVPLERYAKLCGRCLSRAHAKAGDPAMIAGYLGKSDRFDRALARFAIAYADQTEHDHAALLKAVQSGRVEALEG